jgi:hypothetical protein
MLRIDFVGLWAEPFTFIAIFQELSLGSDSQGVNEFVFVTDVTSLVRYFKLREHLREHDLKTI